MAKKAVEEKSKIVTLPEGRLINSSLFVKDQFDEKSTPSYKCEMAYDMDDEDTILDYIFDVAIEEFGEAIEDDDDFICPLLSGDKMAKKREKKGKDGDAYKGKLVLRAKTNFNFDGADAAGGIQVYDEEVELIEIGGSKAIYSGCYGKMAVEFKTYEDRDGNPAATAYLTSFQKTADGERLVTSSDHSSLFDKVADGKKRSKRKTRG